MKMNRPGVRAFALAGCAALAAGSLAAQDVTVYGTAALDGNHTNIELVGGSARFGGAGLAPEVGLQAYHLGYEVGTGNRETWAVMPSVGASYRMPVGQVGARVGYSFQSNDDAGVAVVEGAGGGSGVVVSGQGNYWGPGPELQGIVSYSVEPKYLWSQAQASVPVLPMPPGQLRLGAEVTAEGITESGGGSAISVGPLLKWSSGHNWSVSASGGGRFYGGSSTRDNTWYAKVGIVKYGIHLGMM
ncbi:hypothetical protein [Longimicrobium sp.]|uniref:hypothetical protein n=1 Tax=Longimicrobium sp. TaxID=2029185 RepID=UPI002CFCB98B|nr:hypothetical protein [Longimicrobium sp.]HSU14716.1 hypothetical protein [Longimicrobium sp.]